MLAARRTHDLIIVGGGIYGVVLSLVAAERGMAPLLLERHDFGGQTSFSTLKILHGGLRYLQRADLVRFYESVAARRWFLEKFPGLARPLACLMPLYGNGLRHPFFLRPVLRLNDLLSCGRNRNLPEGSRLGPGKVIGRKEARLLFPAAEPRNLMGGAVWYDGFIPDSQRVLMEALRLACGAGATARADRVAAGDAAPPPDHHRCPPRRVPPVGAVGVGVPRCAARHRRPHR